MEPSTTAAAIAGISSVLVALVPVLLAIVQRRASPMTGNTADSLKSR